MSRARQFMRVAATMARDGVGPLVTARRAMRDFGAIQRTWELQSLIGEVRRVRPAVVVEIGTHRGGTLVCWAVVAPPGAHLVSIDMMTPGEGLGARAEDLARVRGVLRPSQRLTAITGDSHAPGTFAQLREALAGTPIDVLWIDGDHSYEGATKDLVMYGPLVRPGGLIAFHDIHGSVVVPESKAHIVWQEIKPRYRAREFIADASPGAGLGIGVIYVGGAPG
jgi:cephalosporin hydroxylase